MRLLLGREPVAKLLDDPTTPEDWRARLTRIEEVREEARALGLNVGERYTAFSDWPGDAVVTSVVSTRPGELEPTTRWYPIVGSVPYQGYFDPDRAEAEAQRRREDGLDVCVVPVPAYSTLGWFDDPLTGPMLRMPEARLVETVFHELVHATLFLPGEADFNEGFATFVGQEARVRFYANRGEETRERAAVERARALRGEMLALRRAIESLYAEAADPEARAERRRQLEAAARARLTVLSGLPPDEAAAWAERIRLNDACLALTGTYHADLPRWSELLRASGDDLRRMIDRVAATTEADDPRAALFGASAPGDDEATDPP